MDHWFQELVCNTIKEHYICSNAVKNTKICKWIWIIIKNDWDLARTCKKWKKLHKWKRKESAWIFSWLSWLLSIICQGIAPWTDLCSYRRCMGWQSPMCRESAYGLLTTKSSGLKWDLHTLCLVYNSEFHTGCCQLCLNLSCSKTIRAISNYFQNEVLRDQFLYFMLSGQTVSSGVVVMKCFILVLIFLLSFCLEFKHTES